MPIEYQYDAERALLRVRCHGVVTDDDTIRLARAVAEDGRIGPDTRELVDVSKTERADVSPLALLSAVAVKCSHAEKSKGHRVAVVTSDGILAGMARTYGRASEVAGAGFDVQVFRTTRRALAWLNESTDKALARE